MTGGASVDIAKGDKSSVIKGDLMGLVGTVVSLESNQVIFKPNLQGLSQNLQVDCDWVTKYFEPGDDVRVIEGHYKGETGLVTKSEGKFAQIVLDQTNREIKIYANKLKLKSELD